VTYDDWKSTNPDDEFMGEPSEPSDQNEEDEPTEVVDIGEYVRRLARQP
jgi:hypothetical protein